MKQIHTTRELDGRKAPVKLDSGDVIISEIDRPICGQCGEDATHQLHFDLRGNGISLHVGDYCHKHVREQRNALQISLPTRKI